MKLSGICLVLLDLIVVLLFIDQGNGILSDQCQEGFFRCGNMSSHCLAQRFWCNGIEDCPNGADENFHACQFSGGFLKSFFEDHEPIHGLNESVKELRNTCELPFYPRGCECTYKSRLRCQTMGLKKLPESLSANITIAMFQQNEIHLESHMFVEAHLDELNYLYLAENKITDIPKDTFLGLSGLGKMILEKNQLTTLKPGMFAGLENLEWLDLRNNHIDRIEEGSLDVLPHLSWLRLDFNHLSFEGEAAVHLPKSLLWLHLEGNIIRTLTADLFSKAPNLNDLLVSSNVIEVLTDVSFSKLRHLGSLDLSNNQISNISEDTFIHNTKLDDLNLGNNPVTQIPLGLFRNLTELSSLDLSGLEIENIAPEMFESMENLNFIHFKKFAYCPYARYVRSCKPTGDGLSSFENLLASPVLRICIWIVAVVTVSGNIAVIISRFLINEAHKVHTMFLRNLALSDFLMGIYLLIIGAQDIRMREVFNQFAWRWMSGYGCQATGVLAMVSCEVSVLILTCMTAERFITVVYPLKKPRVTYLKALLWILVCWGSGLAISIIPLFMEEHLGNFYGSNAICFPLHIHEPYGHGWEYSAILFLGLNFGAFVTIAVLYTCMCVSIVRTRRNALGASSLKMDYAVVRRFTLIVLTDALCWIPIAVIKMCAFAAIQPSNDAHAWLAVFILPINSALNPLIYSLTTPSFFRKIHLSYKANRRASTMTQTSGTSYFMSRYEHQRSCSVMLPINGRSSLKSQATKTTSLLEETCT